MATLRELSDTVVERLAELHNAAKHDLAEAARDYERRKLRFTSQTLRELHQSLVEADTALARAIARFRFDHSQQIIEIATVDPKNLAQVLELHVWDWIGKEQLHELVQIMRQLEEIGFPSQGHDGSRGVPLPNSPVIYSCPTPINVGQECTLVGVKFGNRQGTLSIGVQGCFTRIVPSILAWSDTAVRFVVPDSVGHVPFHARGHLTLQRAETQNSPVPTPWTDDPNTTITVTLEPKASLYVFESPSYSDAGYNVAFWASYEKEHTFDSPLLPEQYQLFTTPYLDADGVAIKGTDSSYDTGDAGAHFELRASFEQRQALHAVVRITDDWHWDYTVRTEFYITIPQGYSVATGWQVL